MVVKVISCLMRECKQIKLNNVPLLCVATRIDLRPQTEREGIIGHIRMQVPRYQCRVESDDSLSRMQVIVL